MQLAPQRRNVTEPGRKAPALAFYVRCDVGGNHASLDQERTHTAHRVGQCATFGSDARPAGSDQNGGGQVFLERRGTLLQAIAALVQAVTGKVQRQNRFTTIQAQVNAQVRVDLVHRRALAFGRAQFVDDRVLDLQCTKVGVVDARPVTAEFHRNGAFRFKMVMPLDIEHAVVQVFGVLHREALEYQQHAVGQTRPETQPVSGLHVGRAANGRGVLTGFLQTQRRGFFGKQTFEAFGASKEKFVAIRHVYSRA